MFKRLKDRIVEEANTRLPGGQNNTPVKPLEPENKNTALSSEDLITLSDSPSVVVPLSSSQQFSIGDDDGSLSEHSTPQKKANASTSEMYFTPNAKDARPGNLSDFSVFQEYRPSKVSSYVPQSDIESEREEPPTLNLEGISKNQLFEIIQKYKARLQSYKNKYSEVTKNYKDLKDEKIKIENTLIENQDRGLRRIAELREQCILEQNAKAHLEENLQLLLEEKDSRISVLETQINLLKNGNKLAENCDTNTTSGGTGDASTEAPNQNFLELQERAERLEHILSQSKNTIVAQKNQIALLRKQNESLSQELETKVEMLNGSEEKLETLRSEHEAILSSMQSRLDVLEKQQEESVMSMAETKRNMHEELELKEKQLVKAEDEARQYQAEAEHEKAVIAGLIKQNEEKVNELQNQLANTERTLEDEKKNLMQELTRGKTAAVNLMQQELAKKHAAAEEEWRAKLKALKAEYKNSNSSKQDDASNKLLQAEEQLKSLQGKLDEANSSLSEIGRENTALVNTVLTLKEEAVVSGSNFEKQQVSYNETVNEKEIKLKNFEQSQAELVKNIETLKHSENDLKNLVKKLEIDSESKLKEHKTAIQNLESERNKFMEELKILESNNCQLNDKLKNLESERIKFTEQLNVLESNNSQLNCSLKNLKSDSCQLNDKIKNLEAENGKLNDQLQNNDCEGFKLKESLKNLETENLKLTEQLRSYDSEGSKLKEQLKNLEFQNSKLSDQLKNLESENGKLKEQLQNITASEKQLQGVCDNSKKEIRSLRSTLELLKSQIKEKEELIFKNIVNQDELDNLKKRLEIAVSEEKASSEKFTESCKKVENYSNLNNELISKNKKILQKNKDIQNKLISQENQLFEAKVTLHETSESLNQALESSSEKQSVIDNYKASFSALEQVVLALEYEKKSMNESVSKMEALCDSVNEKLYSCENLCEIQFKKQVEASVNNNIEEEKSKSEIEKEALDCIQSENISNSSNKCIVNESCDPNEKNSNPSSDKKETSECLESLSAKYETIIQNLKEENIHLQKELVAMHFNSENQNVDLVKEITQLQQSLDDLQEERNMLSLILQNIEENRVLKEGRTESSDKSNAENDSDKIQCSSQEVSLTNDESAHGFFPEYVKNDYVNQISVLNSKVKTEIDFFSAQTEHINNELKNVRSQFEISRAECTEKLAQLNVRLLHRTQLLIGVKEDYDAVVGHSMEIQNLCDDLHRQLADAKDIIATTKEYENKLSNLKEMHLQKECELKEAHNCQLSEIKTQTENMIKKLNDTIKQKDVNHTDEISDVKKVYEEEISSYKNQLQEVWKTKDMFEKFEGNCQIFQNKLEKSVAELELFNGRVDEANANLNDVKTKVCHKITHVNNLNVSKDLEVEKLNEKLKEIQEVSNERDKFRNDVINLQFELDTALSKIENLTSSLASEQEKFNLSESNTLHWQSKYTAAMSQIKEIFSSPKVERPKKQDDNSEDACLQNVTAGSTASCSSSSENVPEVEDLKQYKGVYIQQQNSIENLKDKLIVATNELDAAKDSLSQESKKVMLVEEEIHQWKLKFQDQSKQVSDAEKLKKECALREISLKKANQQVSKFAAEIEKLEAEVKRLKQYEVECVSLREVSKNLQNMLDITSNEVERLNGEVGCLQSECSNSEAALKTANVKISEISSELESSLAEAQEQKQYKTEFNNLQSRFDSSVKEMSVLNEKLDQEIRKTVTAENKLLESEKKYQISITEANSEAERFKLELNDKDGELVKLKKLFRGTSADMLWAQNQVDELKLNLNKEKNEFNSQMKKVMQSEADKTSHISRLQRDIESHLANLQEKDLDLVKLKEKIKETSAELSTTQSQVDELKLKLNKEKNEFDSQMKKSEADKASLIFQLQKDKESHLTNLQEKDVVIENLRKEIVQEREALQHEKEGSASAEANFQGKEKHCIAQLKETKLQVEQLKHDKTCLEKNSDERISSIRSKLEAELLDCENRVIKQRVAKEEELKYLQDKYETCKKEISAFQESTKDRDDMILKLKANLSSGSKENLDRIDELNRRVKVLEQEQEQLMLQAQERVSATESKCREQIQEKSNQILLDKQEIDKLKNQLTVLNSQLDESLLVGEANRTSASKDISQLKIELKEATNKLIECKKCHSSREAELTNRIQTLEKENNNLRVDSNQVERLKAEKDQLNETLKSVEAKLEEIGNLKAKVEEGKTQILSLTEQLNSLKELTSENETLKSQLDSLEQKEKDFRKDIESKQSAANVLSSELESLKKQNEALKEKIGLLEQFDSSDPNNAAVQQYMAAVKTESEAKEKLKEAETEGKLKQLVKDFCVQMDTKDKEYEQMLGELTEKNENLEEKLRREHQMELSALRQDMFEKDCAIEEMRDHYVILIKEKDQKINACESTIKTLSQNSSKDASDSAHLNAEGSDWDDTWAVPEETCENASPIHNSDPCETHVQQIATMQEELDKSQLDYSRERLLRRSEIKELRILLRLSPPQSLVANNNHGGNSQPIPEPTEFEYLKNIIYEYMMGKEPVTLVKVIAAVLRFSDVQTQQVIRKEESRHSMNTRWLS